MAARVRLIYADAAHDEAVARCSIWARHVWAYLPCFADREGRLDDKPFPLKLGILPLDDVDMGGLLDELATVNLIVRYQVDGRRCIQIRTFAKHQKPHVREQASEIPPPPQRAAGDTPEQAKDEPGPDLGAPEADLGSPNAQSGSPRRPVSGPDPVSGSGTSEGSGDPPLPPQGGDEKGLSLVLVDRPGPDPIEAVIAHYRRLHPKARPGKRERKLIRARLAEGRTPTELITAIDGFHADAWHKDRGKLELGYILRNDEMVTKGLEMHALEMHAPPAGRDVRYGATRAEAFKHPTTGRQDA